MKTMVVAVASLLTPGVSFAQSQVSHELTAPIFVGSRDENYLRYLQATGSVPEYPWSIRGFSPRETHRLTASRRLGPWAAKISSPDSNVRFGVSFLPLNVTVRFNSAFPYGANDGAIWAGRGLTPAIEGGFVAVAGPLSLVVNPIAFSAQNSSFGLMANGLSGQQAFADGLFAGLVDKPQRFGSSSYGRFDPGQTTLRLDLGPAAAGVSTANMGWGPMDANQLILGANAPGFPHAFVGTSGPANVWIGKLHARLIWGRLAQSAYSPVNGTSTYSSLLEPGTRRFASGLVAVFMPRGIPGLEIGGGRFFHSVWPREGIPPSYLTKPFESILKKGLSSSARGLLDAQGGGDNQVASFFARWVLANSGFEVYGEYGREDHNYDTRDFIQEPDHSRMYGLGMRKVLSSDSLHLSGLRAELVNYQQPTLGRNRGEGSIYGHFTLSQGHTNRGQLLGAHAGVGSAAASVVAWDRYDPGGSLSASITRILHQERGTFDIDGVTDPGSSDVSYAFGVEKVRFIRGWELTTGASLVRELNRNFANSQSNLNAIVGLKYRFRR
jgi:hypothetical protein